MPDLIHGPDSYIAANYRKSFAPFTLFGTRQLRFYNIYLHGLNVNAPANGGDNFNCNPYESEFGGPDGIDPTYAQLYQPNFASDSIFARVISSIQTQAEIYGVFHPDNHGDNDDPTAESYFTVMVAGDTHADNSEFPGLGSTSIRLEDAIYNALEGTSIDYVRVYQAHIAGDYMDYFYGQSLNRPQLSQEEQAAIDALKAAQKTLRDIRTARG
jgi:hypothetical protein